MAYVGRAAPKLYFDAFVKDTFDGDGTTTSFTLSKTPGSVNSLLVAVDYVIQEPGVAFTLSDNTLKSFASDIVCVFVYLKGRDS